MRDVCLCVFHTQITTKHSVVQLVHHLSTFHLDSHQQHHAILPATHQSITLLPQLAFILLIVAFFVIVLVTVESVWL